MTLKEIKEKLSGYHSKDYHAVITRIAYSGDEDFVLAPTAGVFDDPTAQVTKAQLEKWGVRPFFCIDLTLSGGPGSEVLGEILLPETGWNKKAVYVGTGSSGSAFMQSGELGCLFEPYAVLHSNLGTADPDVALRTNAGISDHGWRAAHMMAVVGKELVELVYGEPIQYSYIIGGSTGGQTAISSATLFPEDFDGVAVVEPGISKANLAVAAVWDPIHLIRDDGSQKFTQEEFAAVHQMILDYHAAKGYGAPGDQFVSVLFTEEEKREILSQIEATGRFTAEQMDALRAIYQGPVNPDTGDRIYAGFAMGAECNAMGIKAFTDFYAGNLWLTAWLKDAPFAEYVVDQYRSFDFAKDTTSPMMRRIETDINGDSGDLAAFKARGGKLIVIQGLGDECIPPEMTIDWYERVIARQGSLDRAQEFCRLFVSPGYSHSLYPGGINWICDEEQTQEERLYYQPFMLTGCNSLLRTLDRWVRGGEAPEHLVGMDYAQYKLFNPDFSSDVVRTRPVFPYPAQAEYVGGDPNLAASYRRKEGQLGQYIKPRTGRYDV